MDGISFATSASIASMTSLANSLFGSSSAGTASPADPSNAFGPAVSLELSTLQLQSSTVATLFGGPNATPAPGSFINALA